MSLIHLHWAINTDLYFKVDDFSALAYYRDNNIFEMVKEFLLKGDFFGFRRIVGHINFKIMFDLFRTNAIPYILANHIFHTINLILLFLIAKYLSKSSFSSFLVTILYNKIYLLYFSNSHEYLLVFLSLSSIYIFLKYSKKYYLSLILFTLALLTKEVAFTIPFFLFIVSYKAKQKQKLLKLFFIVLTIYIVYQFYFLLAGKLLPDNLSYGSNYWFKDLSDKIIYFLNPILFGFLLILGIVKKRYSLLPILLLFLIALVPNIIFVSKLEPYYLYLPISYLLIYLAMLLPEFKAQNVIIFIFIFILMGGRAVFPQIARQSFPNWEKISLEKVTSTVESAINDPEVNQVNLVGINILRDARLMLSFGTLDLFLDEKYSDKYYFIYNPDEKLIIIENK